MSFQLRKIILWPRSSNHPPREVSFELNKVNVITGASRTGKSAIIPIIDYCLGSRNCSIPIDTIRDHVSWYGVLLQLNDEQILVARKVPEGNKASTDFYWLRAENIAHPPQIEEPNANLENIKRYLNDACALPYFSLEDQHDNNNGYKSRLSIRDLMALIFQAQDIVANQNILFYKTHAHEHREKLRNWFPYILGAETIEILRARQRLAVLERKISLLEKEIEKEKSISEEWKSNIYGHLRTGSDYGLVNEDFSRSDDPDTLIRIGKELLDTTPNSPQITQETINVSNAEIDQLENINNELALNIGEIRKRLDEVEKLKAGFSGYGNVARKRTERLHISKWISEIADTTNSCPVCGDSDHPNAKNELEKISKALEIYERETSKHSDIPSSFDREEDRLRSDLEALLERRAANQQRYDWIVSQDNDARRSFYKRKEMYIFLGHFKASLERFEKMLDGGELEQKRSSLQNEYNELKPIVDENQINKRVKAATNEISTIILHYLKSLDVEEKYRRRTPDFNIKELAIRVMGNEGEWHFLAEVGSASNWVSFHVATMCALQEFFSASPNSIVPNFVIFDQPSQVYFPKVRHSKSEDSDFKDFKDEDFEAVKKIFQTLSSSISKPDASWQYIVLDHADSDIYGGIPNTHEVEIWRDGNKLVPEQWYS